MLHKFDEMWSVASHYVLGLYGLCVAIGLEIYNRGSLAMDGVLPVTEYAAAANISSGIYLIGGKYYIGGIPLLETMQISLAVISIAILLVRSSWDLYKFFKAKRRKRIR